MDRKVVITVTLISLVALALAVLLPGGRAPDSHPLLPWEVTRNSAGQTQVFGLTLGQSTLGEAERVFKARAKATLFHSPTGVYALEAYFQRLALSGLRGDFILSLLVSPQQAEAMFERGERISRLGNGTQKVDLASVDAETLRGHPIANLTYIPAPDLEPSLIESRFGVPERRVMEASGIEHWFYPEKGLDIAVNPEGKEVLQYFNGADFERISAPLDALSDETATTK